jgi:hypothetical protein
MKNVLGVYINNKYQKLPDKCSLNLDISFLDIRYNYK